MVTDPVTGKRALKAVMESFWKLRDRAVHDGWSLVLVSGFRSFEGQRLLWNRYYDQAAKDNRWDERKGVRTVMKYTSVPGLSRHHWGTELDISEKSLRGQLLTPEEEISPKVLEFYHWMEMNAPAFGFCRIYRGTSGIISDEPWHWSYWRFAKIYQHQLESDPNLELAYEPQGVDGGKYIKEHFQEIFQWQSQSIDADCSR